MLASTLLAVFGFSATIIAAPTKRDDATNPLSAANLIAISPATKSCNPDANYAEECRNATTAAHCIRQSFQDYNIKSWGVQSALLSLIMYESGNFSYSQHHFGPGGAIVATAGQGTRNMQTAENNLKYADYLVDKGDLAPAALKTAQDVGPDAVLALVNTDHFGFASAAWYLTTQCPGYSQGLAEESEDGYTNYLTGCLYTDAAPDRIALWLAVQSMLHW